MEKCTEAHRLLMDHNIVTETLQPEVDKVAKTLADIRKQIATAKKHGLGPNLMAQSLILNLKADLGRFRLLLDNCMKQIDATQD